MCYNHVQQSGRTMARATARPSLHQPHYYPYRDRSQFPTRLAKLYRT